MGCFFINGSKWQEIISSHREILCHLFWTWEPSGKVTSLSSKQLKEMGGPKEAEKFLGDVTWPWRVHTWVRGIKFLWTAASCFRELACFQQTLLVEVSCDVTAPKNIFKNLASVFWFKEKETTITQFLEHPAILRLIGGLRTSRLSLEIHFHGENLLLWKMDSMTLYCAEVSPFPRTCPPQGCRVG